MPIGFLNARHRKRTIWARNPVFRMALDWPFYVFVLSTVSLRKSTTSVTEVQNWKQSN
ncbi:MAG: hypothetical protein ACK5PZ_16265 [Pirellula sp.]